MNKKSYKIFVGNVPYECSDLEFIDCFKDIDGFSKAEIIREHKRNISRGFGFVSLKTKDDANNLLKRNDIKFKGRILRFTTYLNENQKDIKNDDISYLLISNIPKDKLNENCHKWLRKIFKNYEPIGKCFLRTNHDDGTYLDSAIIEILNDIFYNDLLEKEEIIVDEYKLSITKYKMKIYFKKRIDYDATYSAYITSKSMNIHHKSLK
jgi:RNA recognition motif-containing protein